MNNPSVIPAGNTKCSYFLVPLSLCRTLHDRRGTARDRVHALAP